MKREDLIIGQNVTIRTGNFAGKEAIITNFDESDQIELKIKNTNLTIITELNNIIFDPYASWNKISKNLNRKLVRESLFDTRFTEGPVDIVKDMRIGKRAKIDRWFEAWAPGVKYTIDDNLNIEVNGNLDLEGSSITELPDNLTVKGYLDLRETSIAKLPNNLRVGGSLFLEGTQISELPDNLRVKGSLYLRGTPITELPNDLKLGGSLDLEGTSITKLPDNLTVGRSLYLRGTLITKLPKDLKVSGYMHKDF